MGSSETISVESSSQSQDDSQRREQRIYQARPVLKKIYLPIQLQLQNFDVVLAQHLKLPIIMELRVYYRLLDTRLCYTYASFN